MNNEDKQPLLKDICTMLPYRVKIENKTKLKMIIDTHKPRWKNKEWTFNFLPNISITKVSNLYIAINIGWLFWGVTICNDF